MTASVELTNDGFAVVDDFGPEGRRPVLAGSGPNGPGVLMFSSRFHASVYATTRDEITAEAAKSGSYSEATRELVEKAKQLGRDYGRIVDETDETDELAGLAQPAVVSFERDGKTHTAEVGEPAVPLPDALLVEYAGKTYSIAIDFGTGAFVARPVLEPELVTPEGRLTLEGAARLLGEEV